jgi:hypothetical protein
LLSGDAVAQHVDDVLDAVGRDEPGWFPGHLHWRNVIFGAGFSNHTNLMLLVNNIVDNSIYPSEPVFHFSLNYKLA